jgi:hypothetical protein
MSLPSITVAYTLYVAILVDYWTPKENTSDMNIKADVRHWP